MKYQTMRKSGTCLATAFACCWDMDIDKVLSMLPDPHEIIWPDNPEPYCYRGHHPDELLKLGFVLGYGSMDLQRILVLGDPIGSNPGEYIIDPGIKEFMRIYPGVVTVYKENYRHALVWDNVLLQYFDVANGHFYNVLNDSLIIQSFYPVAKLL